MSKESDQVLMKTMQLEVLLRKESDQVPIKMMQIEVPCQLLTYYHMQAPWFR